MVSGIVVVGIEVERVVVVGVVVAGVLAGRDADGSGQSAEGVGTVREVGLQGLVDVRGEVVREVVREVVGDVVGDGQVGEWKGAERW